MSEPDDGTDGRPTLTRPSVPVLPPPGRFGVSLGTRATGQRAGTPRAAARGLALVGSAAAVAALYVWDDLLLAAPIVAVASLWGPLSAWLLFAVLYGGVSFLLSLGAISAHERLSSGNPGRLAVWLQTQTDGRRGSWGRRLVGGGQVLGFVLSSFLLGGIVTTWLVRVLRPDRAPVRTAAAACAIFGITFAGQYAGITALVR